MASEDLSQLGRCLAFDPGIAETAALRVDLGKSGYARLIDLATSLRLEAAVAMALRDKNLLPPIPKLTLPDGRTTITKTVDVILEAHLHRRNVMREKLMEIVRVLNHAGILPVLIKGAKSLWIGTPEWRSLRDLDLLVKPGDAKLAQAELAGIGYHPIKRHYVQFGKHHLPELFRDDLPGWVEIHREIAVKFAERLLPTQMLLSRTVRSVSTTGEEAGLLDDTDHVLQGLIHHHFHHSAFRDHGWIDVKGLYEFSADVARLDEQARAQLLQRASVHPRLLAALDIWLAAASDLFACPVEKPFMPRPDAVQLWGAAFRRMTGGDPGYSRFRGLREELQLAANATRLDQVVSAGGARNRRLAQLRLLVSLADDAAPITVWLPWRGP